MPATCLCHVCRQKPCRTCGPCVLQVFLFLTLNLTATHQQVLERAKEQLKSLIAREEPASVYAVLCHARLLVSRAPMIFENDYTAFYCRSHDPW